MPTEGEIATEILAPDATVEAAPSKPPKPKGRRPTSLKTFVVNEGGIWKGADTGEIAQMEYRRPGFLKSNLYERSNAGHNGGGLKLDDMRERAEQAGYLPEGSSINDFLDALDNDVRGTSRAYSDADLDAAEQWRLFDGEERIDPDAEGVEGAQEVFRAQPPRDPRDAMFVNPAEYQFDVDPVTARQNIAADLEDWMDDRGYSEIFTDAEKNEIIDALANERGGYAEDLIDVYLEREAKQLSNEPAPARTDGDPDDIPWPEPEQAPQETVGQRADGAGRSEQDAGSARVSDEDPSGDRGALSESTAAGDQRLIEGVAPITQRDRLQAAQDAPLRGGNTAADDGLFDLGARDQADMFSDPTSPEARPVQDALATDLRTEIEAEGDMTLEVDMLDGNARSMSGVDLLDYLDQGEAFSARLDLCGKGP